MVLRASKYVDAYEPRLSGFVAQEDDVQWELASRAAAHRRTVSDLLLVQVGPEHQWVPFRDVYEVDGHQVPDRDRRLADLFLHPTPERLREQMTSVINESARYNVGPTGNVNVPTLALSFLALRWIGRFHFRLRDEADAKDHVWQVAYEEVQRPTIVRDSDGVSSVPASGTFSIRDDDGAVLKTHLRLANDGFVNEIDVTYCQVKDVEILVPCSMKGHFDTRGIRALNEATYSHIRRFSVTTETNLKK